MRLYPEKNLDNPPKKEDIALEIMWWKFGGLTELTNIFGMADTTQKMRQDMVSGKTAKTSLVPPWARMTGQEWVMSVVSRHNLTLKAYFNGLPVAGGWKGRRRRMPASHHKRFLRPQRTCPLFMTKWPCASHAKHCKTLQNIHRSSKILYEHHCIYMYLWGLNSKWPHVMVELVELCVALLLCLDFEYLGEWLEWLEWLESEWTVWGKV